MRASTETGRPAGQAARERQALHPPDASAQSSPRPHGHPPPRPTASRCLQSAQLIMTVVPLSLTLEDPCAWFKSSVNWMSFFRETSLFMVRG